MVLRTRIKHTCLRRLDDAAAFGNRAARVEEVAMEDDTDDWDPF